MRKPVAWFQVVKDDDGSDRYIQVAETDPEFYVPLYAQPEWIGLSVAEVLELSRMNCFAHDVIRAIEAKLKEKNQ